MKDFFDKHINSIFGAFIGIVIAVLLVTIPFWQFFLILIFALVGAFFGGNSAVRKAIREAVKRIFNKRDDN